MLKLKFVFNLYIMVCLLGCIIVVVANCNFIFVDLDMLT